MMSPTIRTMRPPIAPVRPNTSTAPTPPRTRWVPKISRSNPTTVTKKPKIPIRTARRATPSGSRPIPEVDMGIGSPPTVSTLGPGGGRLALKLRCVAAVARRSLDYACASGFRREDTVPAPSLRVQAVDRTQDLDRAPPPRGEAVALAGLVRHQPTLLQLAQMERDLGRVGEMGRLHGLG